MANLYAHADFSVDTSSGAVRGVISPHDPELVLYRGIPYARPPLGDLRWRPPEPVQPWPGIRMCDTFAPMAMQHDYVTRIQPFCDDFYADGIPAASEDCLYLNIASRGKAGDRMPVYVWLHGGGLKHGFSYEKEFDPTSFAEKGIVVVSLAHRIGVFGYLALPQLTQESEYQGSGNYGLMDLILGLKWVKENIERFGGDPDNVTIGGQSGGTTKEAALIASPEAEGLFRRCIMHSGLKFATVLPPIEAAEEKGIDYLNKIGVPADWSADQLRKLDSRFLIGQSREAIDFPFEHNQDNRFLNVPDFRTALEGRQASQLDFMCGTNMGEAVFDETAPEEVARALAQSANCRFCGKTVESLSEKDRQRVLATYGITRFDARSLMLARVFGSGHVKRTGRKAWAYLFSQMPPGEDTAWEWSWHTCDLWYAFDSLRRQPSRRRWREEDLRLAEKMNAAWAAFIRNGNPNCAGMQDWKGCEDSLAYMELCSDPVCHLADEAERPLCSYTESVYRLENPS